MKSILVTLAAVGILAAGPANASYLFDEKGDSYNISFNGLVEGDEIAGLTANLVLTLYDVVGNDLFFNYKLDNTSSLPITYSEVGSFGFNSTPNFTGSQIIDGFFPTKSSGNIPGGLPNVEFCLTAGPNCSGTASNGIEQGDDGVGNFKLTYGSFDDGVTLGDFYVRYQAIYGPGMRGASGVGISGGGDTAVPEPGTWALMILGFGGAGAMLRRHQHSKQSIMLA
ncbi:MAG TPA: cistern family PEP-CTERM protein [Candidatus Paceibacterota bacterium]